MIRNVRYMRMIKKDNIVEQKKRFEREWSEYILGFEDNYIREEEWNASDKTLEAYLYGADVSNSYISQSDKIKVKRYKRDCCKR